MFQYCFWFMSCFGHEACEILAPRAGIKPIPLYGKAKSQPLDHQGSPNFSFSITLYIPWKKHIADLLKKHRIHSQDLCLLMNYNECDYRFIWTSSSKISSCHVFMFFFWFLLLSFSFSLRVLERQDFLISSSSSTFSPLFV